MSEIKKRCGKCAHWMILNRCPREYAIPGGHRGARMDERPCDKFRWSDWYDKQRQAEEAKNGGSK
jgi:hypothetical protein